MSVCNPSFWHLPLLQSTCVLVIYCCVRNNPSMCQLKTINIYHLSFSVGQESGHNLPGCFCLKGSPKVAIKILTRAVTSSHSVTRGRAAFKLIHMYVGRIQFLTSSISIPAPFHFPSAHLKADQCSDPASNVRLPWNFKSVTESLFFSHL